LVASGSALESSVCVIHPYNPCVGVWLGGDDVDFSRLAAVFVFLAMALRGETA
jgi:hypothetical protein